MNKQMVPKIHSYTDESGQDTRGKFFVVSTIIVPSDRVETVKEQLIEIEKLSGKLKKRHGTGDKKRHVYIQSLLENHT